MPKRLLLGRGGPPPRNAPPTATSGFTRAYAKSVVPLAAAAASLDRIGGALGIGGSCFFVAERAD